MSDSHCLTIHTASPEQTEALGEALAKTLPEGSVVALTGDLGAGKTCFTRGFARGLDLESQVSSPTFTIVNEYVGQTPLYHLDLYRLTSTQQVLEIGCEELFEPDRGYTLVEWADRAEGLLPKRYFAVNMKETDRTERSILLTGNGIDAATWDHIVGQLPSGQSNR